MNILNRMVRVMAGTSPTPPTWGDLENIKKAAKKGDGIFWLNKGELRRFTVLAGGMACGH